MDRRLTTTAPNTQVHTFAVHAVISAPAPIATALSPRLEGPTGLIFVCVLTSVANEVASSTEIISALSLLVVAGHPYQVVAVVVSLNTTLP